MDENIRKSLEIIDSFEVKKICREQDFEMLKDIKGPIVGEVEKRKIIDCLLNTCKGESINGALASYVVLSPDGLPLVFFSLRCGELYTPLYSDEDLELISEYVKALENSNLEHTIELYNILNSRGINVDEVDVYALEEYREKYDSKKDVAKDGSDPVADVFPAIELKLFGKNEEAKAYWDSLELGEKMGLSLFWLKIVDKLKEITNYVGWEYLYIFAAGEIGGRLVDHYYGLGFTPGSNMSICAKRPLMFDRGCIFMAQKRSDLSRLQKDFRNRLEKQE